MNKKDFAWLNVLLVDDSVSILLYVTKVLADKFNITNIQTASSSDEGLKLISESNKINLLFLDLNMPNMDGIQFIEKISQLGYSGYLVIMSGVSTRIISSVELLIKRYKLNHIGTLTKPLDESDFDIIIDKIGFSRKKQLKILPLKTYEIITAINNDKIDVLYQPQIDLISRKFVGVEALCRLTHPKLGLISPDRFIDVAEQSALIEHITLAVLKQSMSDWHKWEKYGLNIKLAVNASPKSLQQPEFADIVLALLEEFNMPAERLCLELTEGALSDDQIQELINLNRLHMRGVELALDDFGKDHSTVERIQKLPLSYLKLDKNNFIENKDKLGQLSIINTSLSLAHRLNLKTIAEGIETSDALRQITELGCDFAQGFYIARPMLAKDILAWSKKWNAQV